jgi:N-acetyl-gamma-glutamyl-phosphate reductase
MKVGIVGASGYAGIELLRLCAGHPALEVAVATAGEHSGDTVAHHTPSLSTAYPGLTYSPTGPSEVDGLDLVFLALPHGQSQHLVPELIDRVGVIVDLAADFRLHDASLYREWYGEPHTAPELLDRFAYGTPRCTPHRRTGLLSDGSHPRALTVRRCRSGTRSRPTTGRSPEQRGRSHPG